jgi:hypothetical protein
MLTLFTVPSDPATHVVRAATVALAAARSSRRWGTEKDGVTFEAIEAQGVEALLEQLRDELVGRAGSPSCRRGRKVPRNAKTAGGNCQPSSWYVEDAVLDDRGIWSPAKPSMRWVPIHVRQKARRSAWS